MSQKKVVLTSLVLLAAACAPEGAAKLTEGETPVTADANPTSAPAATFFVAVMNKPSTTDPTAYKLVAFTTQNVDPASVKFCFDTTVSCAGGQGASLAGVVQDVGGGRKVFLTEKFVKLAANLNVTVLGKDLTGQPLSTGIKIVTKGSGGTVPPPGAVTPPPGGTTPPGQVPPVTPPAAAAGDCYKAPGDFICQVEKECVRLTNEKRATEGKGPLTFHKEMGYVSRLWSQAQADRGSIGHDWFESGTWGQKYQEEFKKQSPSSAENVAMNGGMDDSNATSVASGLIEQWWASAGHHANMVGDYTIMSCGYAKGGDGWYGTQNFGN